MTKKRGRPTLHEKRYKNAGRDTIMTTDVVEKLEKCFSLAYTDEEACLSVGIDRKTLYNYCKKYPDFSTKKELLKKKPNLKAKNIILQSLNEGDTNSAKWWLERKCKEEFSTRQEQVGKDGEAIQNELNIKITFD